MAQISIDDDHAVIEAGYKPQLRRSLGFFSSFAVTFSASSILMGIYANFGYALTKAGPFGFWTWLMVGTGQFLVALVFAELAGRIPLTGAIYNWNIKLANATVGWLCAWVLLFAYCIGAVSVVVTMMTPLQTLVGREFDPNLIRVAGITIILLQAAINVYGVHLASYTNKIAVIAEIVALVVFGITLLAVVLINHEAHPELLVAIPLKPVPYWPAFLLASLLAAWTIIGFELPSDLSEETVNVKRVTPKSIISAVLTSTILGFLFLSILTFAIADLPGVTAASDPISAIMSSHLGPAITKVFLVFVIIAMFAVALLVMATAARVLFAVARDRRIAGASLLTKVSSRKVPAIATILVVAIEIIVFITAKDAVDLYGATTILMFFAYLVTVVSFAVGFRKLPPTKTFSLSRWHWPVVTLAVFWLIFEISVLTIPEDFHSAAKIALAVLVLGLPLYFLTGYRKSI